MFEEKLAAMDAEVIAALKLRSYTSIPASGYPTIGVTAAFEFDRFEENRSFSAIIGDGLNAFEEVFGYRSDHFNPPGGREHSTIHRVLHQCGIKYLDTPWIRREHQGGGVFKWRVNFTGKQNSLGQVFVVRNVVFEPTDDRGVDWVAYAMRQIEAAFRWHRPAIVSSHRVNFCGHIDPKNRSVGLSELKQLLSCIVRRWPDVEFISANELGGLIKSES